MSNGVFEQGLAMRKKVVGAEYVEKSLAASPEGTFGHDFQKLVTEYCWGTSWGRPNLTLRDRSLLNLAMIGALNRGAEFKLHMRGALRNGCTIEEIEDTLIQLSIYAGIPAGVEAFRIAKEVLSEESPN